MLRLVGTALAPVADAAAAARLVGDAATVDRWVDAGEELVGIARSAVDVYAAAYGAMGVEARGVAGPGRGRGRPAARRRRRPELWRAAVEAFGFGHVYEEARSRWRLAEALLADG